MVSVTVDPAHPEHVALTMCQTIYLDKLLTTILTKEVEDAIRSKCVEDIHTNDAVKAAIAKAAATKLLAMLQGEKQ